MTLPPSAAQAHPLSLSTADGSPLAAVAYEPPAGCGPAEGPVLVIGPGMAIPQRFYADFASWLAGQGVPVLSFDPRGIGASRHGPLRAVRADMVEWARVDAATAIAAAAARWPGRPLHWLGHSMGGQMLALLPEDAPLHGALALASGSGYWRLNAARVRWLTPWLWGVLVPLALKLYGCFPGGRLNKIGDLPGPVIAQWRRWCLQPDYYLSEPALRAAAARSPVPLTVLSFSDDEVLGPRSAPRLFGAFTAARPSFHMLEPRAHGLGRIGHFGFFQARRPGVRERLWPLVLRWLQAGPGVTFHPEPSPAR